MLDRFFLPFFVQADGLSGSLPIPARIHEENPPQARGESFGENRPSEFDEDAVVRSSDLLGSRVIDDSAFVGKKRDIPELVGIP